MAEIRRTCFWSSKKPWHWFSLRIEPVPKLSPLKGNNRRVGANYTEPWIALRRCIRRHDRLRGVIF